ncbi:hypothetical protein LFYK43_09420 [Ligilactobacillus salitolerans]|uniref:Uncharacterized protein n=1 Tax=Ligilactobacillus salitolerans TaxID=1808352 RepID=A0A401ISG2_9LACO|nr:hypothetical protein [Ligilactobacillus salitolerans]GBG94483.1 hypothetical protein LFYK43_09420 [Ligilactobacillus salitolerans]
MKKTVLLTLIGGSTALGWLFYKKQQAKTSPASTKLTVKSALKNTTVSTKNLITETKSALNTVEEITTEIQDFLQEAEPKLKKLNQSIAKMNK